MDRTHICHPCNILDISTGCKMDFVSNFRAVSRKVLKQGILSMIYMYTVTRMRLCAVWFKHALIAEARRRVFTILHVQQRSP